MAFDNNKTAAHMFGEYVANTVSTTEKQANPLAAATIGGKVIPWLAKAVGATGRVAPKLTTGETALMKAMNSVGRGFTLSKATTSTPTWLRAAREAGNQALLAGKGTVDDLQRMLGGSFKEHAARQSIADRMAAGTYPMPKIPFLGK
jgi:hypothetical protein